MVKDNNNKDNKNNSSNSLVFRQWPQTIKFNLDMLPGVMPNLN